MGGFYTEEVRCINRKRIGFDVVSVHGTDRVPLARVLPPNSMSRGPKVSKYTVDIDSFECNAMSLINQVQSTGRIDIMVLDEIGKMELFSHRFKAQVSKLFELQDIVLLCTVPLKSMPFVSALKARADCELFKVTTDNRHSLLPHLVTVLESSLKNNIVN